MTNFANFCKALLKSIISNPVVCAAMLLMPFFCIVAASVAKPQGAINTFMCHVVDIFVGVVPSTPPTMQIGYLLRKLIEETPLINNFFVIETLTGVMGILSIVMFFKVAKSIPFT